MGQRRASDGYLDRYLSVEGACNLTWKVLHVTAVFTCRSPSDRSASEADEKKISFGLIPTSSLSCHSNAVSTQLDLLSCYIPARYLTLSHR